ncbi:MAG: formate dehydrogenase accessory sulfurtransferase FdhD [Candidatus Bathyarchaeia archaeon]
MVDDLTLFENLTLETNELMSERAVMKIGFKSGEAKLDSDTLATEKCIKVYVNNEQYAIFIASPTMEKELIIGHLLSEGWIRSIEDLEELYISKGTVNVNLRRTPDYSQKVRKYVRLFTSTQGPYEDFIKALKELDELHVLSDVKVKAKDVLKMVKQLNKRGIVYKATRGVHSAAIFLGNAELVSFSEDVGRHNAIDKVVGDAALKRHDFSNLILLTSGRLSAHLVLKAARIGIPITASIANPIISGVVAAEKVGITLVSVEDKKYMKVYTFQDRIIV